VILIKNIYPLWYCEISAFNGHGWIDLSSDVARSTRLVILIKNIYTLDQEYIYFVGNQNIYTLWGRQECIYFIGSNIYIYFMGSERFIYFIGSETLNSACYILSDE